VPLRMLVVEGELDAVVMRQFLPTTVEVLIGGGKGSLKPKTTDRARVQMERGLRQVGISKYCFLRDRDFDFVPQDNEKLAEGVPFTSTSLSGNYLIEGYRWHRHELESYLIDPQVVCSRLSAIPETRYEEILCSAAKRIRFYQAARWTIGIAKEQLLKVKHPTTRPPYLKKEYRLPEDDRLNRESCRELAKSTVESYINQVNQIGTPDTGILFDQFMDRFTEEFCENSTNVLEWFAAKDLVAAIFPALKKMGHFDNESQFVIACRDWVRDHPDDVRTFFPEWDQLIKRLVADPASAAPAQ
jgi:hypothetical protein